MTGRADIVRVARGYLGTPFHHMGREPGVALDCAGVLICVARELGLVVPDFDVPSYVMQPDGHSLLQWCDAHMRRVSRARMQPGDAVVVKSGVRPQHLALIAELNGAPTIIHASNLPRARRVVEDLLRFRAGLVYVAAYAFPGIVDG